MSRRPSDPPEDAGVAGCGEAKSPLVPRRPLGRLWAAGAAPGLVPRSPQSRGGGDPHFTSGESEEAPERDSNRGLPSPPARGPLTQKAGKRRTTAASGTPSAASSPSPSRKEFSGLRGPETGSRRRRSRPRTLGPRFLQLGECSGPESRGHAQGSPVRVRRSPPGGDLMQQGLGWMGLDPDRSRVEMAPCGETVRHPCEWAAHRVQFTH